VKLFKTSEDGKEIILGFLSPHDLFGEEILFNDSTYTLSALALENTHLCACYKSDFEALLAQNLAISTKVIKMLGDKLSKMAEQLADIAVYDTQNRVARTLVRLAREHGESTENGRRLNFHLTHDDLGALVGASRVMVTNVLKSLRKAGVVRDDRERRFTVSNWFLAEPDLVEDSEVIQTTPACQCFKY
jgi:CRP-like cAMP-binding protein